MIEENQDLNLETDHLEEVIESQPPGQPVVVIQYRTRGAPWYLVLPLLVLVPLGAVAVYHRVSSRARYTLMPPPAANQSTRKAAETLAVTESNSEASASATSQGLPPASIANLGSPLALNSQPIAPGSVTAFLPQPVDGTDQTKPGSPAAAATATKVGEPFKTPASTDLANAASNETAATTLPSVATPANQPGSRVAPTPPVDATRPAPRGSVAIGFSVPDDGDSPFAELPISRGQPGSKANHEQTAVTQGPAEASDPSPDRQPPPTREQLVQDIQAEAAEKAAELKQRREIKDRARDVIDAEAQARVEDERTAFRRDLREATKLSRREAAVQIEDLCNRYGRNYSDDLRSKARLLLSRSGKMSPQAKVRMLRLYGVPEPGILDFLANEIHHMINSRNGPRDSNEVRIDAAKQLLKIELAKDAGGASKGLPAQRVRPAAPEVSNSAPGNDQAR
jgi:hypothetical protein